MTSNDKSTSILVKTTTNGIHRYHRKAASSSVHFHDNEDTSTSSPPIQFRRSSFEFPDSSPRNINNCQPRSGSVFIPWSRIQQTNKNVSFKALFKAFANNTTCHGIRQLAASKTCLRQFIWFSIIVAVFLGWALHLIFEIRYYFTFPVSAQTFFQKGAFVFPDIIICDPIGPIHMKERLSSTDFMNYSRKSLLQPQLFWNQRSTDSYRYLLSHFVDLPKSGLLPEDYIIFCRYQNRPCTYRNFSVYFHHDLMNCFTFHPDSREFAAAGPDNGLTLVLHVPNRSSVESFSGFGELYAEALLPLGLRVAVQQAGTLPHPSENGWIAPKGFLTEISLYQFRSRQLYSNARPCARSDRKIFSFNHGSNIMEEFSYRSEDCAYGVVMQETERECNCSMHIDGGDDTRVPCHEPSELTLPRSLNLSDLVEMRKSHILSDTIVEAANAVRPETLMLDCFHRVHVRLSGPLPQCPEPCHSESYVTAISQAIWPHPSMETRIRNTLIDSILREYVAQLLEDRQNSSTLVRPLWSDFVDNLLKLRYCKSNYSCNRHYHNAAFDYMLNNFLELRLFPRILDVQYTEEKSAFPLSSLMAQLGGLSGLWLGMSIVTLCEILELLGAMGSQVARSSSYYQT